MGMPASKSDSRFASGPGVKIEDQDASLGSLAVIEQDPFPLMKLPPELRNEIYKQILVTRGAIWRRNRTFPPGGMNKSLVVQHPSCRCDNCVLTDEIPRISDLFRTSKMVHSESYPVFYRHNVFKFDNLDFLSTFLDRLPPMYQVQIQSIATVYSGRAPAKTFRQLSQCISLHHLNLHITRRTVAVCGRGEGTDLSNLLKLNGLKALLMIRGIQSFDLTFGEWLHTQDRYKPTEEGIQEFKEVVEVLKLPQDKARITR